MDKDQELIIISQLKESDKNITVTYNSNGGKGCNESFKVKANSTVAFVGKSGTGKTTIFS